MKIGAHVSSRAPFSEAVTRAKEIGCECMQIFANAPQRWGALNIPQTEIDKFVELNKAEKVLPVVIHSIYLLNLATDNPFFYESSIKSLIDDMHKAKSLGALGVNFHVGSTKGKKFEDVLQKVTLAIKDILLASPEGPYLILENSAGSGDIIGDTFDELGAIIKSVGSDRVKVTLDTAHAFASGYDLRTPESIEKVLNDFDKEVGLDRLVCLHLNDSKIDLGGKRDRHEDIGMGFIGLEAFRYMINHPKLKDLPGIIETPGNKEKSEIDNIKILKDLRK